MPPLPHALPAGEFLGLQVAKNTLTLDPATVTILTRWTHPVHHFPRPHNAIDAVTLAARTGPFQQNDSVSKSRTPVLSTAGGNQYEALWVRLSLYNGEAS